MWAVKFARVGWKQSRNSNNGSNGKRCNATAMKARHTAANTTTQRTTTPNAVITNTNNTNSTYKNTMYSILRPRRQCCIACKSLRPKIKRDSKRKSAQGSKGLKRYEVHMQKFINNKCAGNGIHSSIRVQEWSCNYRVWKRNCAKFSGNKLKKKV